MGIFYILYKNAKSIIDHGSQWKMGQYVTEHCLKLEPHRENGPFFLILRKFDLNYHSSILCLQVGLFYIPNKNVKSIINKGCQCKLGQYATEHCSKMGPHCKNGSILLILRKVYLNYQSSKLCLWVGLFYIPNKNAKSIIDKGSQCKLGQSATEHCSKWGPHRKNGPFLVTSFLSIVHKSSVTEPNFFKFRVKTRKVSQKRGLNWKRGKKWLNRV